MSKSVPTVLDLFSGIGAFSLGLSRAGCKTIAFCEIDPFCRKVLASHWPETPIHGDIKQITDFPFADIICGGFPCQDVSNAGKRAGLAGQRSGLYRELVRAIRLVRPCHALVENVAALVGNGLDTVLGDLAKIGYDAEWDCIPASAIGAPHQRDRVWIVAHAACIGRGQGRAGRPPDSFAWIRDATRWHAGHAYRAGLAEREGQPGDARSECQAAERAAIADVWQSRWPCEPALLGMDDGAADRVDRTAALGNSLVPQIPTLIAGALLEAMNHYS
jgi:DNA (cytosine-5)-methyltransferase 1